MSDEEIIAQINENGGIKRVFVEEGCMICNACETTCPDVFYVTHETCIIKPNAGKAYESQVNLIVEAMVGCCVDVIRIECNEGKIGPTG